MMLPGLTSDHSAPRRRCRASQYDQNRGADGAYCSEEPDPQLHIAISPAAEEYLKKRDRPVALDYIAALG